METARVVVALDVVTDGDRDVGPGLSEGVIPEFGLQCPKEAFDRRIVPAVAAATHAAADVRLRERSLKRRAGVLRAAIRMMQRRRGPAAPQRALPRRRD